MVGLIDNFTHVSKIEKNGKSEKCEGYVPSHTLIKC